MVPIRAGPWMGAGHGRQRGSLIERGTGRAPAPTSYRLSGKSDRSDLADNLASDSFEAFHDRDSATGHAKVNSLPLELQVIDNFTDRHDGGHVPFVQLIDDRRIRQLVVFQILEHIHEVIAVSY